MADDLVESIENYKIQNKNLDIIDWILVIIAAPILFILLIPYFMGAIVLTFRQSKKKKSSFKENLEIQRQAREEFYFREACGSAITNEPYRE